MRLNVMLNKPVTDFKDLTRDLDKMYVKIGVDSGPCLDTT